METRMSRNESCPCGSGKKYKKCCGLQKTISITSIIEKEVLELQAQFIQYAMHQYEYELEIDFEARTGDLLIEDEEEMGFFLFLHSVWFALFQPLEDGQTILQQYIMERSRRIQRPQVKEIIQSWTEPRPIAGRMLQLTSSYMTIKDTLTEEVFQVKLLEEIEAPANSFVFAFLVPFGQEWIFFPTVFDLEGEKDEREEKFLQVEFQQSGYDNPIEFLTEEFLDLMNELPFAMIGYGADDFEWPSEAHKRVAIIFEEVMKRMGAPATMIATGMILWSKYSEKVPKLIKKAESYAGAIHYLNMTVNPLIEVTKKEIAEKYQVAPSTLGTAIADLEYDLQEELMQLRGLHLEQLVEALEAEGIGVDGEFFDEFDDWNEDDQ